MSWSQQTTPLSCRDHRPCNERIKLNRLRRPANALRSLAHPGTSDDVMSDVSFYRRRRAWSRDVRSRDVCFPRDGANNELDQIFAAASSIYTKEATPASSCGYLCELNEIYEHVLLLNPSLKSSVVFRQLIRCMSTKRNTMPEFQANLIPVSILITNRLAKKCSSCAMHNC